MKTLLTVYLAKKELAIIHDEIFPSFKRLQFSISALDHELILIDSKNNQYGFDLTSVIAEGLDWVDACIDIRENLVINADCRLGKSRELPLDPKQIIFQPLFLPESDYIINEFAGPIGRGFITPGYASPLDVSLMCICGSCNKSFRLRKEHTGWGADIYFYCESGIHCLIAWPEKSFRWNEPATWLETENQYPRCEKCNTSFKYMNPFRCPYCQAPYIEFKNDFEIRRNEYYAVCLYENSFQRWRP